MIVSIVSVVFFFVYLLSHDINEKMRQSLILLCEAHFAILYILQLNLISKTLERESSLSMVILSQLGMYSFDLHGLDFLYRMNR